MKSYKLITLIMAIILLCGCSKKHKYKACFTVDISSANVNDVITFGNCSDYDGGYSDALWNFGDGSTANSKGTDNVQHSYSSPGTYKVILYVGEKENQSEQTKNITIQ